MTRDELLDQLRRELESREWSELRPDERLAELESRIDTLVEKLDAIRTDYDTTAGEDLFQALDDLAAALSYFRSDLGHAFSETTRLTNELRSALRQIESGAEETQMRMGLADGGVDEECEEDEEAPDAPAQTTLFGD